MNIMVFDTETTSLEKPFCYNIGYVIYSTDTAEVLCKKDFVVEQVWHNPMLFVTAYYSSKKELYISRMKGRKCVLDKFGYITQTMYRERALQSIWKASTEATIWLLSNLVVTLN